MSKARPVVAVIPHYNMPQTLVPLLKQTIAQKYDAIYVLDDHSTTCNIKEVVAQFGPTVTLVAGTENRGAGGNRNRILEVDPKNLKGSVLHFIDADCELLTKNIPDIIRKLFSDPSIGAASGIIYNPNGVQMDFNYYPRLSVSAIVAGMLIPALSASVRTNKRKREQLPKPLQKLLSGYSDPNNPPVAKDVFGVPEGNMLIPYDTFASINGFDASLRWGEGQDLGSKLAAKKLTVRFDPTIAVKHHMVLLSDRKRGRYLLQSYLRLARKYGLPLR